MLSIGFGQQAKAQDAIKNHKFIPFSEFNGDTTKYLLKNFDGGLQFYNYPNEPLATLFKDMEISPAIKTFYPRYSFFLDKNRIHGFYFFIYAKEELKTMVKQGKPIYCIHVFVEDLNDERNTDLYKQIQQMGVGRILNWTPELQEEVKNLRLHEPPGVIDVSKEVKRYLEYHP